MKNYRPFANGKPLFVHIINTLLVCENISEIYINTDSKIIIEYCKNSFPEIHLINRPEHLVNGDIPMNQIINYDLNNIDGQFFLQTHSTNPLVNAATFDKAVKLFLDNFPKHDSLFSVNKFQTRLWDKKGKAVNHDKDILLNTQDLDPLFEENSCIYIFEKESFFENKNRIGKNPLIFEIDKFESVDIDEEIDFITAEQMYQYFKTKWYNFRSNILRLDATL